MAGSPSILLLNPCRHTQLASSTKTMKRQEIWKRWPMYKELGGSHKQIRTRVKEVEDALRTGGLPAALKTRLGKLLGSEGIMKMFANEFSTPVDRDTDRLA